MKIRKIYMIMTPIGRLAIKIDDATILANSLAENGDTILLSPACASWDQYKCFEDRGDEFIATFKKIIQED